MTASLNEHFKLKLKHHTVPRRLGTKELENLLTEECVEFDLSLVKYRKHGVNVHYTPVGLIIGALYETCNWCNVQGPLIY